jgi:TolB-like protein/Tfp pilus assembly protein PilF
VSSIIEELKRRNVVRVAVAYIVVGWVVLQVAEFISPLLQLPEWTVSMALYIGIIGFPFALVFAWAFELTPEGLRRTEDVRPEESVTTSTGQNLNRVIIGLMGVAIAILLGERMFMAERDTAAEADQIAATAETAVPITDDGKPKSIAVLPFVNMSNDPEQDYFSDGISEELLNGLAKIRELRVAARTSSFAFKGKNQDITNIGEQLNVETVLEGSVRKSGQRLRITAQLINVDDGYHIWSETYDRDLTDIFAIQDEISAAIVDALKVHLTEQEVDTQHAVDVEAYNFYLQAQHSFRRRTEKSLQLALKQYQKAIDIAPDYAAAWAGKAAATELLSENHYGSEPIERSRREAQAMLDKAFSLDPDLPQAHAGQALLDINHGEPHRALQSLERAIANNPTEGILYAWRSITLDQLGRHREATAALQQGFRIDPLHQTIRHNVAVNAANDGDFALAREVVTPESELAYEVENIIAYWEGRNADQIKALERALELSEDENDYQLSFVLSVTHFFTLHNFGKAREYANPTIKLVYDSIEDPIATYPKLRDLPADLQNDATKNTLGMNLIVQGRCEEVLELYADRQFMTTPIWGDLANGLNNINIAQRYAWCLRETGRTEDSLKLARRLRQYIEQAAANGQPPQYFVTLAEVQMLLGDEDEALGSLKIAWQNYQLSWIDFTPPWFEPLQSRPEFQELRDTVHAHMNAERAKLGWEPVSPPQG